MEKKNPNPTSSLPEFYNNKENWGEGPWLNEPGMNEPVFFDYKGYRCMLLRNDFGSWCGYVEVSAESKWAKYDDYMDIPLEVHGGITFGRSATNKETGQEIYIIGFDCNHGEDYAPITQKILFQDLYKNVSEEMRNGVEKLSQKIIDYDEKMGLKKVYRTLDYATEQLKGLVDQMDLDPIDTEKDNGNGSN